jgi:hypothetical protein
VEGRGLVLRLGICESKLYVDLSASTVGQMSTPSETIRTSDEKELRQGDILLLDGFGSAPASPSYGIIINADCDLANGKTDGVIAILPVYTFERYLEAFWIPNHLRGELQKVVQATLKLCKIPESESDALILWLKETNHLEASAALIETHGLVVAKHAELHELCRLVAMLLSQPGFHGFEGYCRTQKDPKAYARKHLDAAKKAMGEGHFFLSEIAGQPGIGFVVRMRRIISLAEANCFKSLPDLRSNTSQDIKAGARVARLSPTYQYRVAQLFAYQYSRIGLPDEVTALSTLAIEELVARIGEAEK